MVVAVYPAVRKITVLLLRTAFDLRRRRPREEGPLRISFLIAHAWGMGGTIRTTLNLAGALAESHEVELLSVLQLQTRPAFAFPAGVTVTALDDQGSRPRTGAGRIERALRARRGVLIHGHDGLGKRCSLWTDVQIVRALWQTRADVLIATRPSLTLIAAELAPPGTRTVGQEHLSLGSRAPAIRRALLARVGRLDAVATLTEGDRDAYARAVPRGPRIVAIPNAVTPLGGGPSALTEPVILTAGRLSPQKDQAQLIRAFAPVAARHPEWTLRICGRGPRRRELETLVSDMGLEGRVILLGAVEDMGRELAGASVFALSSRFEGFPMVLLEAMGKGLPIVSTDCPTGPRELIDDGRDGILVPPDDVPAFTAALLGLVEDADKRRRLGAAALEASARYDLHLIAARWETLLSELA